MGMPHARALFNVSPHLYELRIRETGKNWRIFYRTDADRILIIHQINKTTRTLPEQEKTLIKSRLAAYDEAKTKEETNT